MKSKYFLTVTAALFAATFTASAQVKKPINKVPFLITKPGNYYLAKDLIVTKPAANGQKYGIGIDVNDVTIDLNGRTLTTAFPGEGVGIQTTSTLRNIRVRNGSVVGFDTGLYLSGHGEFGVEDVIVRKSTQVAVWMHGENCVVRRCTISETGGGSANNQTVQGVRLESSFGVVEDCTITRFSRAQPTYQITAIYAPSGSAQIRRNLIQSVINAPAKATAIFSAGEGIVTDNTLNQWAIGLDLSGDIYRDNSAFACTMKYTGGTDGGGNK
jgi:hypothetical protein